MGLTELAWRHQEVGLLGPENSCQAREDERQERRGDSFRLFVFHDAASGADRPAPLYHPTGKVLGDLTELG